jgi:putative SOS response-associated peptidase YedK
MPVILDEPGMTAWLDPRTDDERLQSLCRPAERELTATPVAL